MSFASGLTQHSQLPIISQSPIIFRSELDHDEVLESNQLKSTTKQHYKHRIPAYNIGKCAHCDEEMRNFRNDWDLFRHNMSDEMWRYMESNRISFAEFDTILNVMEKNLNTHFIIEHTQQNQNILDSQHIFNPDEKFDSDDNLDIDEEIAIEDTLPPKSLIRNGGSSPICDE